MNLERPITGEVTREKFEDFMMQFRLVHRDAWGNCCVYSVPGYPATFRRGWVGMHFWPTASSLEAWFVLERET